MEVSSWENHLFLWVIVHRYVSHNQRVYILYQILIAVTEAPQGASKRGRRGQRPRRGARLAERGTAAELEALLRGAGHLGSRIECCRILI